eukprot:UC1_evm2s2017
MTVLSISQAYLSSTPTQQLLRLLFAITTIAIATTTAAISNSNTDEDQNVFWNNSNAIRVLTPDVPLTHQNIKRGASVVYPLDNLVASQSYEVRVSYLGYASVDLVVEVKEGVPYTADSVILNTNGVGRRRQLLDAEKAMFSTDEAGHVNGWSRVEAHIHCRDVTVPIPGGNPPLPVTYNVVLETLHLGVIPSGAFRLAAIVLISLAIAMKIVAPRIMALAAELRILRINERKLATASRATSHRE